MGNTPGCCKVSILDNYDWNAVFLVLFGNVMQWNKTKEMQDYIAHKLNLQPDISAFVSLGNAGPQSCLQALWGGDETQVGPHQTFLVLLETTACRAQSQGSQSRPNPSGAPWLGHRFPAWTNFPTAVPRQHTTWSVRVQICSEFGPGKLQRCKQADITRSSDFSASDEIPYWKC